MSLLKPSLILIWATVLVTFFLKVLLWKERHKWENICSKAESWLSENVPDVEVEKCLYNNSNKFIIRLFKATQWVDENQQRSLGILCKKRKSIIIRRYVDKRVVRRFLSCQNESGYFELTSQLAEAFGFSSVEEAKKHIETHFSSYSDMWVDAYQKAQSWLCKKVPDDKELAAARIFVVKRFEVEQDAINEDVTFKEYIETSESHEIVDEPDEEEQPILNDDVVGIIRTKVNHVTINPKWNEIHLISAHGLGEKFSVEVFDENLFISDKPLGSYVLDTNILLKSEDQIKLFSGSFSLQIGQKPVRGHLNLEHLYILISWRNVNGSWEFTDKLARFFNYKSDEKLKQAFFTHLSSDKDLLKYDLSILATALTIINLRNGRNL
ncbi:1647_t:CDS:2 [Dentiscutata heterogama]|uniref:1647_t:CDS:1 n=1 Tax=Dentiscutata heterogama TaxID=1316150 RepID=A0ACA9KU81_9GLOM|nr:1647_t:CDS:2 [Dentiscutata heterogama]